MAVFAFGRTPFPCTMPIAAAAYGSDDCRDMTIVFTQSHSLFKASYVLSPRHAGSALLPVLPSDIPSELISMVR